MNVTSIVNELEDVYHIGFASSGSDSKFEITLDGSLHDRFHIIGEHKDNIRLNLTLEPEKYGGNFLRLLNSSGKTKRKCFVALWNSINIGTIKVMINDKSIDEQSFLDDNELWVSFKIKYTLIPFSDDNIGVKVCTTLCGMVLSLIDYSVEGFEEGEKTEVHANKYERNPINREICLAAKGYVCAICGFNFEDTYGEVGKHTIEVHHLTPVSQMGDGYIVNPLDDLIPVCSNCHTIIHKSNPPYTPTEVSDFLKEHNG